MTYKKGNRGVRFLFEATDADAGQFKYVQFSDHNIAPVKAEHFHIFFGGTSQEALFEEMDNWPTYYPDNLSGQENCSRNVSSLNPNNPSYMGRIFLVLSALSIWIDIG